MRQDREQVGVFESERQVGRRGEERSNTSVLVAAQLSALSSDRPRHCAGPAV